MVGRLLSLLILVAAGFAVADESVPICYGYGCIAQAQIRFSDAQLDEVGRQLALAVDAEHVEEQELGVRAVTAVVAHQGLLVERGTGGQGRRRWPPGCGWPPSDGQA